MGETVRMESLNYISRGCKKLLVLIWFIHRTSSSSISTAPDPRTGTVLPDETTGCTNTTRAAAFSSPATVPEKSCAPSFPARQLVCTENSALGGHGNNVLVVFAPAQSQRKSARMPAGSVLYATIARQMRSASTPRDSVWKARTGRGGTVMDKTVFWTYGCARGASWVKMGWLRTLLTMW
ncbi:hypothetical protein DFH08DRAFT_1000292 [Mycena albidolilacea]|uniref:Uncharacterized protein n=1 Tax=Mycena albidolilacea TaxID=1033008 RepID=A0AAD7A377_9AGAR|nr:hypothetical protein DFH08DRAFT_1000292 [Mycena albidolilacea]